MSNLKLDGKGDIIIGRGTERTSGLNYTSQLIGNRLKTLYGEWVLNKTIGIPWYTDILKHNYDLNLTYNWISRTLLNTPNVTGVVFLELVADKASRILYVNFTVSTIYGELTNKVEV